MRFRISLPKLCSIALLSAFPMIASSETLDNEKINRLIATVEELKNLVKNQGARIETLERENQTLKSATSRPAADSVSPEPTSRKVSNLSAFNPEIGVASDITGIATESEEDREGNDKLSVRELELIFGHDIDPYSRFDSTLTLSDLHDPEIEEAYISHFGLPGDIQMRLGRIRPKVGKASALHRDQLDTVDEPLVVQQFLGEEGLYKTSAEFTSMLPWSDEFFVQELTLGGMEGGVGDGGNLFGETRRRPSFYAHLKNFWEISEYSDFEVGGSYLLGSSDEDESYEVNAFGVDLTYIKHFNSTNRLKLAGEIYLQDRDEAAGDADHDHDEESEAEHDESGEEDVELPLLFDDSPLGFYSLADYRLSERFGIGARFDYVEPVNLDESDDSTIAYTGYFTFYQSEFARWRAQYQYVDLPGGEDDNRFFFQSSIAIGVHKHKLQ